MRDRGLQGVEAVIQRQQGMPAEGDDDRLFLDREHRGMRCSRPRRAICGGIPLPPFGDGLGVDAMALGPGLSGSLDYAVSLDGSPLSLWRSHGELGP